MQVVLAGLDRLPAREREDLDVPDLSSDARSELADTVRAGLATGPVLVLHPAWAPDVGVVVDSVHAALDTSAVLRHATSLPPLAAAALADLLPELAAELPDHGMLGAGLRHAEAEFEAGAVLGSVARLEHVATSLGQHLASWVPRGRFLAVWGDDGRVERLPRKGPIGLPEVADDKHLLLASGTTPLADDVRRALDDRPGPDDTGWTMRLPDRSADWWGTDELVEFAMAPRDVTALAGRVADRVGPTSPCDWCGRPAPASSCPWCGHTPETSPEA